MSFQAARQLVAELAVVQGIFVDIPDGAKRATVFNAARQKVKDMGATLTPKVDMWLTSEMKKCAQ